MTLQCIDHLIKEHRLILRAVCVLEAMSEQAGIGNLPPVSDVDKLLDFFHRFADEHHQGKEESVLFPALRRYGNGGTQAELHQMAFEHEQERSLVTGLQDALKTRQCSDFAYYGNRMAAVLGHHIYKEDNVLFALVEKKLPKQVDSVVLREMMVFDNALKPGLLNEFIHNITELERRYAGKAA
jgi:hemerythrin-like domain-containing protein